MSRLSIPDEFLPPNYGDGSIANIPATIAALLGVQLVGLPALPETLWRPLGGDVKRVVSIVIDGWGWNLLEKERPSLQPLLQQAAVVEQLTSIFPSTTFAALSSLWTAWPATLCPRDSRSCWRCDRRLARGTCLIEYADRGCRKSDELEWRAWWYDRS